MLKGKWPYILMVLLLIIIGFIYTECQTPKTEADLGETPISKETTAAEETESPKQTAPSVQEIVVDIEGAVKKPGVYKMTEGSRVADVVEKAGGYTSQVDKTKVNLAKKLVDEMLIYVPKVGESITVSEETGASTGGEGGSKININTATEEQLQQISGIGPAKAKAIIEYREKNGLFQSIEDLDKVSGIGEKTLEEMKDQITVQ